MIPGCASRTGRRFLAGILATMMACSLAMGAAPANAAGPDAAPDPIASLPTVTTTAADDATAAAVDAGGTAVDDSGAKDPAAGGGASPADAPAGGGAAPTGATSTGATSTGATPSDAATDAAGTDAAGTDSAAAGATTGDAAAAPTTAADAAAPAQATSAAAPATGDLKRGLQYLFGKADTYNIPDERTGTVLGYDGVPTDLKVKNQHFVHYPIPSTTTTTTTTYDTGYLETISMSKWVDGTTGDFGLAIDRDGKVWGWGGNHVGQLGNGKSGAQGGAESVGLPARVTTLPSNLTFVQVSTGGSHAMALASNGDLYTWGGLNNNGQLGQGNTNSITGGQASALKVAVAGVKFKQVSAGKDYSLAVATDGSVYSWGYYLANGNGLGFTTGVPTKLPLSNIRMVSAGFASSAAVGMTGALYTWGQQVNGALGNGVTTAGAGAIGQVGTGISWKQVSVGNSSMLGVSTSGALYGWGYNGFSQLGTGDATNRPTPTNVGLSNVRQVNGTAEAALAVTTTGSLYGAGTNVNGALIPGMGVNAVLSRWTAVGSGVLEASVGNGAGAYKTTDTTQLAQSWGVGEQNGRGGLAYSTPGLLSSVWGSPTVPYVTETVTTTAPLPDAAAAGSSIVFGAPGQALASVTGVAAKNIRVVTVGGVRYLRGDVPPHDAGPVDVYLKWNDGTNTWQNTGSYVYTIALAINSTARPAPTTDTVSVITSFYDPQEVPYAGASVVDFSIPDLAGSPAPLLGVSGWPTTGVPWVSATATTKVTLRPGQAPNNGPFNWLYNASSTARVGATPVQRNAPGGAIEFFATPDVDVHLWKTGIATTGAEVGMTGAGWKVHPDSTSTPGTPDTTKTVTAFGAEVVNPNAGTANRKQGWFTATLAPGTYWLVETKSPQGFQLLAQPLQFTVAANGSVTLGTGKSALTRVTNDWDYSSTINTIVVRDPGATALPASGSASWAWLMWAGAGILGVAALLVVRRALVRRRGVGTEPAS